MVNFLFHLILTSLIISDACAFFLSPTIYELPKANKTICQNSVTDILARPNSQNPVPYLECANDAYFQIIKATLVLSSVKNCPLQFSGLNQNNAPSTCDRPAQLFNNDATAIIKQLCGGQNKCLFQWKDLPVLACNRKGNKLTPIPDNDQSIRVEFQCITQRPNLRPFKNKRYDGKWRKAGRHPLRKLSYNRLSAL